MPFEKVAAVVTGLAFVFFLLALIGSGLLEALSGLFAWRATYLRRATDVLLGAARRFGWGGPSATLAAHLGGKARHEAIVGDPTLAAFVDRVRSDPLVRGPLDRAPSYVPASAFAAAVLAALGSGRPLTGIDDARRAASALPGPAGAALATLAANTDTLDGLRRAVALWYEDAMREASALYKCNAQRMLFAIAGVLTLGFDIDSLRLARALWGGALPFGWTHGADLGPVPGWCLTVLAVSMGAPFWFDLLQNVANIRAAAPRPQARGA